MITCPNCGATARNGAKFCTTCGTKLTGILPASQPSPESTAPASDASNPSPVWAWPAVAETSPVAATPDTPAPASHESDLDWDWPAPFSNGSPVEGDDPVSATDSSVDAVADEESEPIGASPAPTSEQDDLSAWAAQWNATHEERPDSEPSSTIDAATDPLGEQSIGDPIERIDDILIESGDSAAEIDDSTTSDASHFETSAPENEGEDTRESRLPEDPSQERNDDQKEATVVEPVMQFDAPAPEPVAAPEASKNEPAPPPLTARAATRATALLDELRTLLSESTATDGAASDTALPPEIASSLRDALGVESSFDALRAVAAQANEQPRDLYAMMDLGRHAGDILSLIAERDRLRAAITTALAASSPEA